LHWSIRPLWEQGGVLLAAGAFPNLSPVFGNLQLNGRQIKHLPVLPTNTSAFRQITPARTTTLDGMFLNMIRFGNLVQTMPSMAGLPAIRISRILPQTFGCSVHIGRWRFAAIAAVLGQLLFQFFNTLLQGQKKIKNRLNTSCFVQPPQIFPGYMLHKIVLLFLLITPENKLQYEYSFV
jgi:hypothetical protein